MIKMDLSLIYGFLVSKEEIEVLMSNSSYGLASSFLEQEIVFADTQTLEVFGYGSRNCAPSYYVVGFEINTVWDQSVISIPIEHSWEIPALASHDVKMLISKYWPDKKASYIVTASYE